MSRILVGVALCAACGGDPARIELGQVGPLVGDSGRGGFRFGVATSAAQIEDGDTATDWWLWTAPAAMGGLGKGTFVGDATRGYSMWQDDLALLAELHVDSYRFSIEWARIEPHEDQIDEAAIANLK